MAKDTYKYNGKEYERIPSEAKCLGCDLLDEETGKCLNPEESPDCVEISDDGGLLNATNFQFKEIKL
jgi:hypothetical protein